MKEIKLQEVYLPVKVENELPIKEGYYLVGDIDKEDVHWFDRYFATGTLRHLLPKSWLKPTSAIVFTPSEYKQHLLDIQNKVLENAETTHIINNIVIIDKQSITNVFEQLINNKTIC